MTHLIVSGLNYHSAPIAIRERFSIPQSCIKHALHALSQLPNINECAILSTCNRTEVYAVVSDVQKGWREIEAFFASAQSIADHAILRPNFRLIGDDVALHLFRVASGLDSMILGEGQILGQIKSTFQFALDAGTAGPILNHLFNLALGCGKRVRSETGIGRRAVSMSSAAVELAWEKLGGLANKNIVVIGAGKMAQMCLKQLMSECESGRIVVVNRDRQRINEFLQGKSNRDRVLTRFDFSDRHRLAAVADLVIVATSSPEFVLTKEEFSSWHAATPKRVCIVDISVPRNVDPSIAELSGVRLFHADDLAEIVRSNLSEREALVGKAEEIIFQFLSDFNTWQRALPAVPIIAGLRRKIEEIRQEQTEKILSYCDCGSQKSSSSHEQAEHVGRAIVSQILHHPSVRLKSAKDDHTLLEQAELLATLFNLDPLSPKHTPSTRGH